MAKHNDMPELNSVKAFLTTLLTTFFKKRFTKFFTQKHPKPPCQHPLTAGNCVHPHQTFLQGALQTLLQNGLPGQHRYCFEKMQYQMKMLHFTAPDYFCSAAGAVGDSDMKSFTEHGLRGYSLWLKNQPMDFVNSLYKLQS